MIRIDHKLALAILRAAGLPTDDVTNVSCSFPLDELGSIVVTYRAFNADTSEVEYTTTRFVADPDFGEATA